MERLAQDAMTILQIAENGLRAGHQPSDLTILLGPGGVLRVIADSDWPLQSLQSKYGARSAYRVTADGQGVRVEGRDLGRQVTFRRTLTASDRCRFEASEPSRLPGSRALLTGSVAVSSEREHRARM